MNHNASRFDLTNARSCAQASADAYQRDTVSDAATDTHCLIVEESDHVIIAFRGSASIRNWITDGDCIRNLLATTKGGDQCEVHAGFLQAFESIIQPLASQLKAIGVGIRPVFVCGHSLGGALAVLAALELKRQQYNIARVYTFGQPRVGNAAFKRLYEWSLGSSTFRVVYQEDIVPRIPHLPAWHDLYRHGGTEVFISSVVPAKTTDDFWLNPPLWRLLMSDAWGLYRSWLIRHFAGALEPLLDHHIDNYLRVLANVTEPPGQAELTALIKEFGKGPAEPTAAPAHPSAAKAGPAPGAPNTPPSIGEHAPAAAAPTAAPTTTRS